MSNTRRFRGLTLAIVALGVAVAMPQAYAFNPQPDPPARQKALTYQKNLKTNKNQGSDKTFIWFDRSQRTTASGAPCKPGVSCGAVDGYKGTKN
ncbi:MAG TPA: hypothetical protein VH249_16760 [Xanthobacteraceae bacterium]|nr:hypothetical protein [Xanthobacteraceae bacterium]